MALSGSCQTSTWTGETTSGKLVFNWTATQNQSNNTSTISWNIKASVTHGWITYSELSVKINNVSVYYRDATNHTNASNGTQLASGTRTLTHNADGTCSFSVAIGAGIYSYAINKTGSGSFTLDAHTVYSLSLSAGTGSTITVNRTSSGYASTGNLSNGARLYKGDKLTVTFAASSGYGLYTHTVNGSTFTSGGSHTVSANVAVASKALAAYSLSISAGTGSTITVNRTSSGVGSKGNLSNGATIYKNDTLKITFAANTNYAISTHTVNGSSFTSGNTHTVSGNVTVVSTAQELASSVSATDARIESNSVIIVTRYNNSYYHSLQYTFGSLSGYIKADGTTSSSEVKYQNAIVSFQVPASFYAQIPNAKTGTCTITCRTYSKSSSTTVLGSATICTFKATTALSLCAPTVTGDVVDTNEITATLTGNSAKLVRYRSTAQCSISATPLNSATITSKYINNSAPTNDVRTFKNVSAKSFVFKATDSRGYKTFVTKTPTIVSYIPLTCNPVASRSNPTSNELNVTVSGDYYRGSFGAVTNSLTLQYRYKDMTTSGATWSSWTNCGGAVTYGTNSYSASFTITINDSLSYQKAYSIQIRARDGHCTVNGSAKTLSSVTKTVNVSKGIPVYDWGSDDFQINVNTGINGDVNISGDINMDGQIRAVGNIRSNRDFLLNGDSIVVKQATVSLTDVAITTQSTNGAYYTGTGYSPSDYNIRGTIIGIMLCGWVGAAAVFLPYYSSSRDKIMFMGDISQTVSSVSVLVTYL